MRNKKDIPVIAVIVGMIIITLALLLFLVFRPVEGEQVYWELYSKDWTDYITEEDFAKYFEVTEGEKASIAAEETSAGARNYAPPLKELKFGTRFSSQEVEINTLVYQIAQAACINEQAKFLPQNIMDPLMILAQANAEYGGLRGSAFKILAPAVPAVYLQEFEITPDLIKNFNIKKAVSLNMGMTFNTDGQPSYMGPLQMAKAYGGINSEQTEFESLLTYKEGENKVLGTDPVLLQKVISAGFADRVSNYKGDRWNWNDACVRSVASWDYSFQNKASDKEGLILDKYKLCVALAVTHNVGCSVMQSKMAIQSTGFIKGCSGDNATIQDIWNFMDWISSPAVVTEVGNIVDTEIAKNNLTGRSSSEDMKKLITVFGSSMEQSTFEKLNREYPKDSGGSTYGWNTEPPRHALVVLYNYIMLEKLYSGM